MKRDVYVAIIGDVIDSKKIVDRRKVQNKLEDVLKNINNRYKTQIASKFTITLGDEFQGLLFDVKVILKIIHDISFEMYPIQIRFGIGVGGMSTEIYQEQALGADGPAYHQARNAIEYVKKNQESNARYHTNIAFFPNDKENSQLLNLCLTSYSLFFNRWSEAQFHTVKLMQQSKRQIDVAHDLDITQQAVVKRLQKAGYYNFNHLYNSLNQILEDWSW